MNGNFDFIITKKKFYERWVFSSRKIRPLISSQHVNLRFLGTKTQRVPKITIIAKRLPSRKKE